MAEKSDGNMRLRRYRHRCDDNRKKNLKYEFVVYLTTVFQYLKLQGAEWEDDSE
jgi:hypothetical protein